jgi:bifunctional pyridoxal-dependent enzyme with beta-cystathionase and maltose regulon repressor activities
LSMAGAKARFPILGGLSALRVPEAHWTGGAWRVSFAAVLCNPHNPTGQVLSRAELERGAALARRYDVVVVADENHAPLTLPGAVHTPFVSLNPEVLPPAVTVISAAKAWNVAGLKCAVVVAGSEALRAAGDAARRGADAGRAPWRAGCDRGLPGGATLAEGLLAHLDRNRRLLAALLATHLPAVGYVPPQASNLAWLDCTALGLGDDPAGPRRPVHRPQRSRPPAPRLAWASVAPDRARCSRAPVPQPQC